MKRMLFNATQAEELRVAIVRTDNLDGKAIRFMKGVYTRLIEFGLLG